MPRRKIPTPHDRRSRSKRRLMALGLSGLVVFLAVGAFVAWPKSGSQPTQVILDKSKGAANAAVTVIEYGDLQ